MAIYSVEHFFNPLLGFFFSFSYSLPSYSHLLCPENSQKTRYDVSRTNLVSDHCFLFQVESFRKTFDLFDTSAKGYIGTKDIGKLIRSVGFCPSSKDIDNIIKQFRNSNDAITFDDFLMVISGLTCTGMDMTL